MKKKNLNIKEKVNAPTPSKKNKKIKQEGGYSSQTATENVSVIHTEYYICQETTVKSSIGK